MTKDILLGQGAEARVYKSTLFNKPVVNKVRFNKKYRHPKLDSKILSTQMNHELRLLLKCIQNGISVPAIYHVDKSTFTITMEFIEGAKVRDILDSHSSNKKIPLEEHDLNSTKPINKNFDQKNQDPEQQLQPKNLEDLETTLAALIALNLAKMHGLGIVHGDLTTSNMLINNDLTVLTLIDFGLGSISKNPEQIAVDLYVFERALKSSYSHSESFLSKFFPIYTEHCFNSKLIMSKLSEG
ncbi:hypothetical protein BB560_004288 [Smittium megazygosporum]|uniref:non-specific serine/threonine protein kinase n=1 Tax=Smittium megazygosporum TaxID=133381 RepID=A0A2T9Z9M0_9FUNG|nr:hypothetical protein BB560_004288 [Smittium megazygosporum]